jgi:hypothetical protein
MHQLPSQQQQQSMIRKAESKFLLGWREWVTLPELGVPRLKCKVDTGARTSSLHAFYLEDFEENGRRRVRFGLHPVQGSNDEVIDCIADVIDEREVCDSGGHREMRLVIVTPITIGPWTWPVELTLTNRDTMLFRMLLGRSAINGRFLVNPHSSFQANKQRVIATPRGKKRKKEKKN